MSMDTEVALTWTNELKSELAYYVKELNKQEKKIAELSAYNKELEKKFLNLAANNKEMEDKIKKALAEEKEAKIKAVVESEVKPKPKKSSTKKSTPKAKSEEKPKPDYEAAFLAIMADSSAESEPEPKMEVDDAPTDALIATPEEAKLQKEVLGEPEAKTPRKVSAFKALSMKKAEDDEDDDDDDDDDDYDDDEDDEDEGEDEDEGIVFLNKVQVPNSKGEFPDIDD